MSRRPFAGFSREALDELIELVEAEIVEIKSRPETDNAALNIGRAFQLRAARRHLKAARKERKRAKVQAYKDLYSAPFAGAN